jgi:hypothetical protein
MNTTQYSELDRIKLKIKALAAKTVDNGCSEAEAMAAMQGVGRLLRQYNLTMSELDVRQTPCKTIEIKVDGTRHRISNCLGNIGGFTDTKPYFQNHGPSTVFYFFGQEQDLDMAQYVFKVCKAAIDSETHRFKSTPEYRVLGGGRSATTSFQHGLTDKLNQRMRQMKKEETTELHAREAEQHAERGAAAPTSTALVVLKKQLIEQEFKAHGPKLRYARVSRTVRSRTAYGAGLAAGDRVNLSRPINSSAKSGLLK